MSVPVTDGLHRRRWTVYTTRSEEQLGAPHREHLSYVIDNDWILVTFDDLFLSPVEASGLENAGIIYVQQAERCDLLDHDRIETGRCNNGCDRINPFLFLHNAPILVPDIELRSDMEIGGMIDCSHLVLVTNTLLNDFCDPVDLR